MDPRPVLVTGATGYVGGRLVPRLLEAGHRVRVVGRSRAKILGHAWARAPQVEIALADVADPASLERAARGCRAAYWLVHSMAPGVADFEDADRRAAEHMVAAAAAAGLERIVYLGGLGDDAPDLSKHLRSRAEVGRILQAGAVPTTVLRAAMILGSGSASFEILRYLVDRLPAMVTPRWVDTECQPVAIRDVLADLVGVLDLPEARGASFDVGGADVLTYRRLMAIYAEEAGLRPRWVVSVPVLTPRLSSYWIHLVTPVPASLARPLAEGLRHRVVCRETRLWDLLPRQRLDARTAIRRALGRLRDAAVESHWTDAGAVAPAEWADPSDPAWAGGTVREDDRRLVIAGTPEQAWAPLVRIGGRRGWYYGDGWWRLRGALDRLVGGVGLRRGRRDDVDLHAGDALDFWRVVALEPGRLLRLVAEMRLPGKAILEFRVAARGPERTEIRQIARFLPRGLLGLAYWAAVAPLHHAVFQGMLTRIGEATGRPVVESARIVRAARGHGRRDAPVGREARPGT